MAILLYNSLTKQKEEFTPIEPGIIKIYICGQTVYDYCHLGHARKAIVFDMIRRWFLALGFEVIFVENITDIDDKIIKKAKDANLPINEITQRYITYMQEDFNKLGILAPTIAPKATDHINNMLKIIKSLIENGYAYIANNGDIYYKVRKFNKYGQLSGRNIDQLNAGERVAIDIHKNDPLDFVLWKSVTDENEAGFDSEFGRGRPGWHIECSAMSLETLGKTFDIHGGGQDLQFPHHENEIAQSEAYTNCKLANYWLHNGFLNINEEKMSKSLGNFLTLRELLKEHDAEVIKFFMLKTHYRSPLNFNFKDLAEAKHNLGRLYGALKHINITNLELIEINNCGNIWVKNFMQAMNDDFNTPLAISILLELATEVNKTQDLNLIKTLASLSKSIGFLTRTSQEFFQNSESLNIDHTEILQLIEQRKIAKLNKDFNTADKIRADLLNKGIILEDSTTGTTWRFK